MKNKLLAPRGFFLAALITFSAMAGEENLRPFAPGGPVHEVSVTSTASTAVRLMPTATGWLGCTQYKLENLGTTDVNVGFGSTAAIAETNAADIPAPGNTGLALLVRASSAFSTTQIANVYLSAKTASGTSTIRAGCGTGAHTGPGGNVTVSGGSVQIAPSNSSTTGIAPDASAAVASSKVFCTAACNFYSMSITNGATTGYVLLFNATSAPVDGAVTPAKCFAMPGASSTLGVSSNPVPVYFSTGLTAVYSSTGCFTKTASATAMFSGEVKQ